MRAVLPRSAVATCIAVLAMAIPASPAMAVSVGEPVSGITTGLLAITAGSGAVFTSGFTPGSTANATGVLTATTTNPSWTLTVHDAGAGGGHMAAANPTLCSASDSQLTNALQVGVTAPLSLGGFQSAGTKTISGTPVTVASATSQLLAANVLTTNYSQVIPGAQRMETGCPYSLTATYTLQ